MTPEQVLSHPPRVLTQAQREFYFSEGYLLLPKILPAEWIERLRAATDELVERSRKVTKSDTICDLEPGHRADAPRLRRVSAPVDQHPAYWDYVLAVAGGGHRRRPGRARRQVPPLQAQLQVGEGRRGGEVALRHLVLAAHQLLAAHRRHLPLRLRHGPGPAAGAAEEPPHRADAHPVRREGALDRLPARRRRGEARPVQGGARCPVPRARSRCTTAARCTTRRRTSPTSAGRCCSTRCRRPTPSPTRSTRSARATTSRSSAASARNGRITTRGRA